MKLWTTTDGLTVYELDQPTPEQATRVLLKYPTIVGHDLKPLIRRLPDPSALIGRELVDTEVGAWLANPDMRDYALERVWYDYVSETLAAEQAAWPLAIWRLRPLVVERLTGFEVLGIFTDLEMPLLPVLATMEHRGIRVATKTIDDLLEVARKTVAELEGKIWKMADGEFNINSPSQLGEVLFTKLAIKGRVRRTGGGAPSTAAAELEKLRDEHPIIELVLQYREMAKLKSTYIEPFPGLIGTDGRIHTTYHQVGTATGRLSSSDPNLQNVPTRTELGQRFRAAFIADTGWKLVSLDYSQLELRLAAHIAHDETMIEAFRAGEDIHTRTASEVFGVAPAAVTKDMRRQAKVLNFGILYGMGVLGFARAAGVGRDQAKRFIEEYFARFPGIAKYMERTKQEAYEQGYVTTLLGRRRPLPDITSRIPQLAASAERMAINHPIQGTEADLVKSAMLAVDKHIRENKLGDHVRMLLQVHDELVMEIRTSEVPAITEAIRKTMEHIYRLDVPLTVDAKIGDNWAEMEPLPRHA
jgi:DNA polymerase-1